MSDKPISANELLMDGSMDGWISIFQRIYTSPGDVLLFYGGERNLERYAASWHLTLLLAVNETGKHLYRNTQHIVPLKLNKKDVSKSLMKWVEHHLHDAGVPNNKIEGIQKRLIIHQSEQYNGEEIAKFLNDIPDGSAVAVLYTELYRFPNLGAESKTEISTWSGIEYNLVTREKEYFEHLVELTRQALAIADIKGLFVTLFCEEYSPIQLSLPADLQCDPRLAVVGEHDHDEVYQALSSIDTWIDQARRGEVDLVLKLIAETIHSPINQALITSKILFASQRFTGAWDVIQPYLDSIKETDGKLMLSVAQTAMAAGKKAEARQLLLSAAKQEINSLSDINAVFLHARKLGLQELSDEYYNRLCSEYPTQTITLNHRFYKHLRNREFAIAADIALAMQDDYGANLCKVLLSSDLKVEDFLTYAKSIDRIDAAYLAIANEAKSRGMIVLAKDYASKVVENPEFISLAMQIRIEILADTVQNILDMNDEDLKEFRAIMRYIAFTPSNVDIRFKLEDLFESKLGEATSLVILSTIVQNLLINLYKVASSDLVPSSANASIEDLSLNTTPQNIDVSEFYQKFLESLPQAGIVIGRGELRYELKPFVSSDLLDTLVKMFHVASNEIKGIEDIKFLNLLLHAIAIVCRELGDTNIDMQIVSLYIGQLTYAGYDQVARDLAETSLLILANNRNELDILRVGEGWRCYAEAFHRTGNMLSALRSLCFCFLCYEEDKPNLTSVQNAFGLIARIYRDLGLDDFALDILSLQKRLGPTKELAKEWLHRLEVTELSVKISKLEDNMSGIAGLELLERARQLLKKEIEPQTLITLIGLLIRQLKLINAEIPLEAEQEFNTSLSQLKNEPLRIYLASIVNVTPDKADLQEAIIVTSSAHNYDDLAYQLRRIFPLAKSAVRNSTQNEDVELFIVAAAILSQPVLALKFYSQIRGINESLESFLQWQFRLLAENSNTNVEFMLDTVKIRDNISPLLIKSIADLTNISIDQLQSVVDVNETVVLVCQDDMERLCRVVVSSREYTTPELVDESNWSPAFFNEWRKSYPRRYGEWQPAPDPFTDESPSEEIVIDTMRGLSAVNLSVGNQMTIIPNSALFGFPFTMSREEYGGYLGEFAVVSTVPSISWLLATRKNLSKNNSTRNTWLGSPNTNDWTIHYLRERLSDPLNRYNFNFVESDLPRGLNNSGIAVIVSHGGLGIWDRFHAVTDSVHSYSANEFAAYLRGSGCVVLFVCHSGRSDTQFGNLETIGVVSELLKANVKSVIAPSWPLHVAIAEAWLPSFLEGFSQGITVGQSAYNASLKVRQKFVNPCAWLALQVYGDATYRLESDL